MECSFRSCFFVLGQISSLSIGEKIEKFTQSQLQNETINFIEKIFWYTVEFIFANGSWWGLGIGIIIFCLVSLVRVYEVKFLNSVSQKFEPNLEWAKEKISLSLNSVEDRYITYNKKEYEELNQPIAIQDCFLHVTSNEELNIKAFLQFFNNDTFQSLQTIHQDYVDVFQKYTNYEAIQYFKEYLEQNIQNKKLYLLRNEFIDILKKIQSSIQISQKYINIWKDLFENSRTIESEYGLQYLPALSNFYRYYLYPFYLFFVEKKNNLSSFSSSVMLNNINENNQLTSHLFKHTLISGEAMSGKTHMLSDIAEKRINNLKPTILIYAQKFEGYERPIQHIMKQLQLEKYNYSDDEFLEILDKWGQSSREIVFLIIDAINETTDKKVWINHFIEFVSHVKKYKNIALIMSIRDVEKEWLFNDDIKNYILGNMVELAHKGFENIEYTVLKKFCEVFKIDLPSFPLLSPIFANPGLLFLFFDTLLNI